MEKEEESEGEGLEKGVRLQRPDLMERGDLITWEKGRGGGRFINVSRSE